MQNRGGHRALVFVFVGLFVGLFVACLCLHGSTRSPRMADTLGCVACAFATTASTGRCSFFWEGVSARSMLQALRSPLSKVVNLGPDAEERARASAVYRSSRNAPMAN